MEEQDQLPAFTLMGQPAPPPVIKRVANREVAVVAPRPPPSGPSTRWRVWPPDTEASVRSSSMDFVTVRDVSQRIQAFR